MRFLKWLAVMLVLGVLAGIAVPALAAPLVARYAFKGIYTTSCEPYGTILIEGALTAPVGEVTWERGITNLRTGATLSYSGIHTFEEDVDIEEGILFRFFELVPEGTRPGDMLVAWINGTHSNGTPISANIAFDCSTGLPWTPSVAPVTGSEAAPFLAVPGPGGAQACGVFNVLGHGAKIIQMSQFPNCTGPASKYTVYCFTDHATWTNQYISNLAVDEDGNLTFTSGQHGHCALFPAP